MKIIVINTILLLFLLSCSENNIENIELEKQPSSVQLLIEHTKEFDRNIYSYETPGGNIHIAVGFGIANSIMVEGEGGNIIIDTSDSIHEAELIYTEFRKLNSNPISAIIYTHNHGDHNFGTSYYVNNQENKPMIIAHESTDYYMQRILGILNPIISKRSTRMFGGTLDDKDLINVGIGKSLNVSKSPLGYVKADTTFKDELKLKISGINIELYHAPGETNDQIFVWLPKHKSLMPGDNIYKTFPNLYTIRGTTHRDVQGWVDSLDHMRSFNPQYIFPSHTKVIEGKNAMDALTIYRDAIQYVHDQTIRLMNKGLLPEEIASAITLPPELAASPFLYEFYGTVRWSVKSIFNGYLGWFSGEPADLDPLSKKDKAKRLSLLAGGDEELFLELEDAIIKKDMQWSLELISYLESIDYKSNQLKSYKKEALEYIGKRSSNPNKRNYFLVSAQEIDLKPDEQRNMLTAETLNDMHIDTFFKILATRYNPSLNNNDGNIVCFNLLSSKKSMIFRNHIIEITDAIAPNCNLEIEIAEILLKQILIGYKSPIESLATGEIIIKKGGSTDFLKLLSIFR